MADQAHDRDEAGKGPGEPAQSPAPQKASRKKAKDAALEPRVVIVGIGASAGGLEPLLVLDTDFRIVSANSAFSCQFEFSAVDAQDRRLDELRGTHWDMPKLQRMPEKVIPQNKSFVDHEMTLDSPAGPRRLLLSGRRIEKEADRVYLILLTLREVSNG